MWKPNKINGLGGIQLWWLARIPGIVVCFQWLTVLLFRTLPLVLTSDGCNVAADNPGSNRHAATRPGHQLEPPPRCQLR